MNSEIPVTQQVIPVHFVGHSTIPMGIPLAIGDPNNGHMPHYEHLMTQPVDDYHSPPESSGANVAPTYDEIFPALPESEPRNDGGDAAMSGMQWNPRMKSMKPSNITQVFRVAPEERKYREIGSKFGEQAEQAKICADIMNKTSAHIEMSVSKDGTLTFLITGKEESVLLAKRMISSELQTQASASLPIPKEHHRFILGKNGKKLSELEQNTGTKIQIPRQNETSDQIKIVGTKEAIDKAVHEIQLISNEAASRANERLSIPKIYHPFICGPFNETLNAIMNETKAKISVPPPSVHKEEISITGERDAVIAARDRILRIYEEKQKKCQTVSMEVRKAQHKYIVGPKGQTLQEIFSQTGVSVEIPSTDSNSETITLRGEQDKLGPALTVLYEKAHSEVEAELDVPSWYHKYILGPKGSKFQEISQEFPKVNVSFEANEDKIRMHGPVAEVEKAKEVITNVIKEISSKIVTDEIRVDSKYHRYIIGKNGVHIKHIREETGAQIHIPSETAENVASNDIIRIEGSHQSVLKAKQELQVLIKRIIEKENEVSKDLMIEQRFHKQIIGAKGEAIKDIRDKFNQVSIGFPEPGVKSDRVTIRGNKKDVELCYKFLAQKNKDLMAANYRVEVPIFKQFHKFIIGREGSNIKKIRDETNTKIDLPAESAESDVILITGLKENVEKAKERIQEIQNGMANVVQVDIIIPAKIHNYIIGAKGRLIRQIMEECGGVQIKFPPEGSGSDKVSIIGPKECVQKAKQQLIEISNEQQTNNYSVELKAKPEHHRFLIGKNGTNIKKVREKTGARIFFPSEKEESPADRDSIIIMGKKEEVMKAKEMIEESIRDLEKVVEGDMRVAPKYHKHFVAKRGAILKQIGDEFGGVSISFPRNNSQKDTDKVILKGAKECVEGAKQRINEIIEDLDAQITIECVIDSKYHRTIMGTRGTRVQTITKDCDVRIKFPERGANGIATEESNLSNGDINGSNESIEITDKSRRRSDVILITGRKENCEAAQKALLALIPITVEVEVPFDLHRFIIGSKGREVKELMETHDVSINVPPASATSDLIKIQGTKDNVEKAKEAILERVQKLEEERLDREAKSYSVSTRVPPVYHPKIIGRGGTIISKIREKYDVQIQFPERGDSNDNQDVITIFGYEKNANEAKDAIENLVKDLSIVEVEIDSRVHPRLIGTRGKNIRKIMDQYRVDIKFPRENDSNPDLVVISGTADNVDAARDHLLNLAEEYLDDVNEQYTLPPSRQHGSEQNRPIGDGKKGFVVKGGPWEQSVPDTSDAQEFPSFYSETSSTSGAANVDEQSRLGPWGPKGSARQK